MKESNLVRKIIAEVKKRVRPVHVRKLSDQFSRGFPDLVIYAVANESTPIATLVVLEVEVKTDKGKLSKIQEAEGATINSLAVPINFGNLRWITARSVADVLDALESADVVMEGDR